MPDFAIEPVLDAVNDGAELVVISQVMFMTGQIVRGLDTLGKLVISGERGCS